jgi:CubicO group peptidase (beta-lactamase class C family)
MIGTFVCALGLGILPLLTPALAQGDSGDQSGEQRPRQPIELRLDEFGAHAFPGVAYASVDQDGIREIGVTGVKQLGSDEPIGPDTPFLIGSISKSFTAIAVMQLVEAGQLSLDDPLSRHLPAFVEQPAGAITIRQLLSHTSGYSTYQGNILYDDDSTGKGPITERVDRLATMAPAGMADVAWAYSNANYQILGRLIEVVSGQSFPTYMTNNILEPAGMLHSFVSDDRVHSEMATGHKPWFGSKRPIADRRMALGSAPQGGIVASAADLARYMLLMMNGKDDIIRAETKAAMMSAASDASPFYGLGWFIDEEDGTVWHSGASPGFESLMTLMPAQGKGVVVLVNAGSGTGFGGTILLRNSITAAALGLNYAGERSQLWQKATFLAMASLPLVFLLSMLWAWRHRVAIRAKSGPAGIFSLWFPLLTTLASAWVLTSFVPSMFGVPLATLSRFQPDMGLAMLASAVTGVAWAAFRLVIAYTGSASARLSP